jgi:hypothetical protein
MKYLLQRNTMFCSALTSKNAEIAPSLLTCIKVNDMLEERGYTLRLGACLGSIRFPTNPSYSRPAMRSASSILPANGVPDVTQGGRSNEMIVSLSAALPSVGSRGTLCGRDEPSSCTDLDGVPVMVCDVHGVTCLWICMAWPGCRNARCKLIHVHLYMHLHKGLNI